MTTCRIPTIVHVTVHKETAETRLGISFERTEGGRLLITSVAQYGPFQGTALKPGYQILSINNDISLTRDPSAFFSSLVGEVSMLACSDVLPPCTKLALSAPAVTGRDAGIRLSSMRGNLMRVDYIKASSPFANTNLRVGDVVLSVNNMIVGQNVRDAMLMLRYPNHDGFVTVFFLSRKEFREMVINSLGEQLKVCKWNDDDTCTLQEARWKHSVKIHFERNWSCRAPEAWTYQHDPQRREAMFDSKWYRETVACAKKLNRLINEELAVYQEAVKDAANYVPEAVAVVLPD